MKVFSQLATLTDTKNLLDSDSDNSWNMISYYDILLTNLINGKISIKDLFNSFRQNYYILKITVFFPDETTNEQYLIEDTYYKGHCYYIFYHDKYCF